MRISPKNLKYSLPFGYFLLLGLSFWLSQTPLNTMLGNPNDLFGGPFTKVVIILSLLPSLPFTWLLSWLGPNFNFFWTYFIISLIELFLIGFLIDWLREIKARKTSM